MLSSFLPPSGAVALLARAARGLQQAAFWDLIQPPRGWLCGCGLGDLGKNSNPKGLAAAWACDLHRIDESERPPTCGVCDRPLRQGLLDQVVCVHCAGAGRGRKNAPGGTAAKTLGMERQRLLCLGQYKDPPLSAWILAFKHGHRADLAEPLGALLAQRVLTRWGKSEGGLGPGGWSGVMTRLGSWPWCWGGTWVGR